MSRLKKDKVRRQLNKQLKQRAEKPLSIHFQRSESPRKRMRRMARDHQDVLRRIESALVQAYHDDDRIDDRVVIEALKATQNGEPPGDRTVLKVYAILRAVLQAHQIPNDMWQDGLRVVIQSVKDHSTWRDGDTSYLDFVTLFLIPEVS